MLAARAPADDLSGLVDPIGRPEPAQAQSALVPEARRLERERQRAEAFRRWLAADGLRLASLAEPPPASGRRRGVEPPAPDALQPSPGRLAEPPGEETTRQLAVEGRRPRTASRRLLLFGLGALATGVAAITAWLWWAAR